MGGGESKPKQLAAARSINRDIDEERADDDFWFSVVERTTPYLPDAYVFKWNKDKVKEMVFALSDIDLLHCWDFREAYSERLQVGGEHPIWVHGSKHSKWLR